MTPKQYMQQYMPDLHPAVFDDLRAQEFIAGTSGYQFANHEEAKRAMNLEFGMTAQLAVEALKNAIRRPARG